MEVFCENFEWLSRMFDLYCGQQTLEGEASFSMRFNKWHEFCSDFDLAVEDSVTCDASALDRVFIGAQGLHWPSLRSVGPSLVPGSPK
eukprot:1185358-Prorocentrum_minimum.AAC.2